MIGEQDEKLQIPEVVNLRKEAYGTLAVKNPKDVIERQTETQWINLVQI